MGKVKILLADDHLLIRQGLKSIIETLGLAEEIFEADNGVQAIELSRHHRIDLYFLDYRMPEMGGYDTASKLLSMNPLCKIIIVTAYSESEIILNLLNIGVLGFLSKNTNFEEIELVINKVLKGERYLNKALEERIQRESNQIKRNSSPISFTKRENDVMLLLSKGKTSRDISQSLGLSQKTIETYRCRLLDKVGVKNSIELVDYFRSNGFI